MSTILVTLARAVLTARCVQCDLWSLQTMSDNTQTAWDTCMSNKNYKVGD